jgi:hypothetical protein
MKLPILFASEHHPVAAASRRSPARYKGRRPMVSETRPKRGWRAVDVRRNAVDNQEAELDAWK